MLLDDIADYLTGLGIVGTTEWPVYKGYMPDDQDQTVGVFPTGGLPADTLGRENERPTFMVRLRVSRYAIDVAYAKWYEIFDALQDAQAGLVGSPDPLAGYTYIQATHTSPMQFNDSNGRPNLTSNWRVLKAR